ncbi:MAG: ATP-binding protein, partial [Candidatus Caldarchaeum sp.]|nr:ATP-binding protein [Candidatus Caldarchaeum sp.]
MLDWSKLKLEQIGIVASPARETDADCILQDGMERSVTTETLVLIDNRNGNKILAVARSGVGSNDSLKTSYYNPGVAYAKTGKGPSTAKEFFGYKLVVVGDVTDGVIKQNRFIIAPASPVYRFEQSFNPMTLLGKSRNTVGYYATGQPTWKVPVLSEYIPHHIGVFGVTGSGKSYLTRYQIIPLLREAGYDVLIFDWKGSDYAPHYDTVYNMGALELDDESVRSFLAERLDYFGSGEMGKKLLGYLEEIISEGGWKGTDAEQTLANIKTKMKLIIEADNQDQSGKPNRWASIYWRRAQRYLNRLRTDDVEPVMGEETPERLIEKLREKHVVVIDLSYGAKEQKLSIFLSVARFLRYLMEEKKKLGIALVVDEAPQYCPWNPRGL